MFDTTNVLHTLHIDKYKMTVQAIFNIYGTSCDDNTPKGKALGLHSCFLKNRQHVAFHLKMKKAFEKHFDKNGSSSIARMDILYIFVSQIITFRDRVPQEERMSYLIIPEGYKALLDLKQTEHGIKLIKDFFQMNLSSELRLRRVTAPLFVLQGTGINDDLNGVESPVSFAISDMGGVKAEVVHSLAKWKRLMLAEYGLEPGYGIYTDMNAIRADEELGNLHSLYVDQWDWERVITPEQRNVKFLKEIVCRIFSAMKRTEYMVSETFEITPCLPENIHFIHSEELRELYPDLTPKDRENAIAKKFGAVFIIGIGCQLKDGTKHDGRAPDYDDYSSEGLNGLPGLNGDLIIWNDLLDRAVELSSMGIRVDKATMLKQLKEEGKEERLNLYFHKRLMDGSLPLSIGGGIGQSRLCMFYLRKAHIGEIQASIWPENMRQTCKEKGINLV